MKSQSEGLVAVDVVYIHSNSASCVRYTVNSQRFIYSAVVVVLGGEVL